MKETRVSRGAMSGHYLVFVWVALMSTWCVAAEWADWRWLNPQPQGYSLSALAHGGDTTVAIGGAGTVVTKAGEADWQVIYLDPVPFLDDSIRDIAWTGERFVAVGHEFIITSEDGRHWDRQPKLAEVYLQSLIWDGTRLIGLGSGGTCVTSPDGLVWESHPFTEVDLMLASFRDIAWSGNRYIGVGKEYPISGAAAMFSSEDGLNWERVETDALDFFPSGVTWGDRGFVVVGGLWPGLAGVMISEDGLNWQAVNSGLPNVMSRVRFAAGHYVALGAADGTFAMSTNGIDWTWTTAGDEGLGDVVWTGNAFTVVGSNGFIASTPNGQTWQQISSDTVRYDRTFRDMVCGDDLCMAVGSQSVSLSADGMHWSEVMPHQGDLGSVEWGQGLFWVTGYQDYVGSSPDGLRWQTHLEGSGTVFWDIAPHEEAVVAVGGKLGNGVIATYTYDGPWNFQTFPDISFTNVVRSRHRFVATGDNSLATSEDGLNWTVGENNGLYLRWLATGGELIVGAGFAYGNPIVAVSSDGFEWSSQELPFWPDDIIWDGLRFVVVGNDWVGGRPRNGFIATSSDGTYWDVDPFPFVLLPACLESTATGVVIAGDHGMFIAATDVSAAPRRGGRRVKQ